MDIVGQIKRFILYAGDALLLYGVLAFVLKIRYGTNFARDLWDLHFWPFTIVFLVWMVVFYIAGLYDWRNMRNGMAFYILVFQTVLINAVIGIVYFYAFSSRLFSIRPQVVFVTYVIVFAVLFLFWRRLYNHLTENQIFQRNVLCIGGGTDMDNLMAEINSKTYLGYRIVECVNIQSLREKNDFLKKLLIEKKIDTVVTSLELVKHPELISQFYQNLFLGVRYVDLPTFYEQIAGRVPVAAVGQLWFLENLSENEKQFYEFIKRGFEIIFTLVAAVIGLALSPLIALGIKLSSPGPVLFIQKRVGKNGKIFRAMKFRTMYQGSETFGPQWTKKHDSRITPVGRFLRKTKLDEIPQLVNILRGEMSYIGPRPEQPEFVAALMREIPYYNERHLIKPGLTGWAQIHFPDGSASTKDTLVKLQYDLYYIKYRSLLLDMGVILKTINIVLTGQGR